MRRSLQFLFWSFLLVVISCKEDTIDPINYGSLFGEVLLEDANNDPVEDARITTNPPTNVVFTDDLGRFAFESIAANTYTIRVEKEGFITSIETVTINSNFTTNLTVKLVADSIVNTIPLPAKNPSPIDQSLDESLSPTLLWQPGDTTDQASIKYEINLIEPESGLDTIIATALQDTFFQLQNLDYGRTYYWQVYSYIDEIEKIPSPIWSFSTLPFPQYRMVFTRANNGVYGIYAAPDNSDPLLLTAPLRSCWRPRISPLRDRIAYLSTNGGKRTDLHYGHARKG